MGLFYRSLLILIYSCCCLAPIIEAGKVLMYMPVATKSHKNVWRPLAFALADRGHEVTMVTMFEESAASNAPKKYREIIVDFDPTDLQSRIAKEVVNPVDNSISRKFGVFYGAFNEVSQIHEKALQNKDLRALIEDPETRFDVTFVLPVLNEVGLYLSHRFGSSTILFMSSVANSLLSAAMGYYDNPAVAVHSANLKGQVLPSLLERTVVLTEFYFIDKIKGFISSPQLAIWHDLYPDVPVPEETLWELERNASFGFYFSNSIFDAIRPTLPNTIDVGFIHCRPPKTLPKQFNQIVEASGSAGVILVSFGSWISTEDLPNEMLATMIKVLASLPHQVIWKWRNETFQHRLQDYPNLHFIKSWLPQQDILGQPKTKLFITQGGMMSVQEGLYHQVPMLVVPLFADQMANGLRAERQGYGKIFAVDSKNNDGDASVMEANLMGNITELLGNSSYAKEAKRLSKIIKDDINSPVDKAVFWTEYVMRHPGVRHLRSPGSKLSFFHFHNIDVAITVAVILLTSSIMLTLILWKCASMIVRRLTTSGSGSRD